VSAFDVRALVGLRRVTSFDVSPCGTWLAVAASEVDPETRAYRSGLWRVPSAGGEAERLVTGLADDSAPCFRPDGSLAFLSDRDPESPDARPDKGARKQVWALVGDELEPLTDEALGVSAFRCAQATSRMVLVVPVLEGVPRDAQRDHEATRKEQGPSALHYRDLPVRFWDHWLPATVPHFVCLDARGRRDLTPEAGPAYRNTSWSLSADGSTLVCTRRRQGRGRLLVSALQVFDLDTGRSTVVRDTDDGTHGDVAVDATGSRIAAVTSRWVEGRKAPEALWVGDRTGQGAVWDDGTERWLRPAAWQGDTLFCTADDAGETAVFAVTAAGRERCSGPGSFRSISERDPAYAIHHQTLRPPEVVHLSRGPVTSLAGEVPPADVTHHQTEVSDGASVAWWRVRPAGAEGPLPTLLWIHGGPISAWGDQWHWRWNALVMAQAGWQVILPNPRGSTGYGQAFVDGIWGNQWGGRCFDDLMELCDELSADAGVDAARMVAMGGSFGGYMTNWIGTQTDRFAALVTHASLFSFGAFYGATDMPAYWGHMLGCRPWGDRADLDRYSPDRHVAAWVTPVLVIHGDKDYRVPIGEALHLFEALRAHEVDAELLVFPDENHWIERPNNIEAWYGAVIDFLDRKVGQGAGAT